MSTPNTGTLKDLKDTYKKGGVILPALQRHVLKEAAVDDGSRDQTVLHPSEMAKADWCPRKDYYRLTGATAGSGSSRTSFRQQNIFDYGHSIHDKYQRWFGDMGVLWGDWQCKTCYTRHQAQMKPISCNAPLDYGVPDAICGGTAFKYKEVPLRDPRRLLGGHADGVIVTEEGRYLLEVKSIGLGSIRVLAPALYHPYAAGEKSLDDLWMGLNRPFASHVRQAMLYAYMVKLGGADIDDVLFLYEFKATQDAKEFVVKYTEPRAILDEALGVANAVKAGSPPPRRDRFETQGAEGKDCGACVYRSTCWGSSADRAVAPPKSRVVRSSSAKRKARIRRV